MKLYIYAYFRLKLGLKKSLIFAYKRIKFKKDWNLLTGQIVSGLYCFLWMHATLLNIESMNIVDGYFYWISFYTFVFLFLDVAKYVNDILMTYKSKTFQ